MRRTHVLSCECLTTKPGKVFTWFWGMMHSEGCRAFRREHPEYIEPVRHEGVESKLMDADEFDRLYAIEPHGAWRWKWRQPRTVWDRLRSA